MHSNYSRRKFLVTAGIAAFSTVFLKGCLGNPLPDTNSTPQNAPTAGLFVLSVCPRWCGLMTSLDFFSQTTVVTTMNKVKNSLQDCDRSWSIHIYSGRHLLCSLYPSHAWVFFLGATLSGLLIFAGFQGANCETQPSRRSPTQSSQPSQIAPPLQVD